jgi:hypothetical protein
MTYFGCCRFIVPHYCAVMRRLLDDAVTPMTAALSCGRRSISGCFAPASVRPRTRSWNSTTARGSRLTTSVGGTLTGRGGNFIILDDPLKPQDAGSELARDGLVQWYGNTLLSRLDNKVEDAIVVVMQRLHVDDFVAYLLDQGGWTHLNLPAIAETEQHIALGPQRIHVRKPGEVLHPEREPKDALDKLRREMGSMDFNAQYQQAPVPEGGNLVKWEWFSFYDHHPCREPNDRIIVSWDTALTAKELSSYSACVILQVHGETVYVLDVFRERLECPELKRKVIELHRRWRNVTNDYALLIENKARAYR